MDGRSRGRPPHPPQKRARTIYLTDETDQLLERAAALRDPPLPVTALVERIVSKWVRRRRLLLVRDAAGHPSLDR